MNFNCLNCGLEKKVGKNTNGKYCSNKCQGEYQSKVKTDQWLKEGNWVCANKQLTPWIKRYIFERDKECTECGIIEWNGKSITLEVDHIDGNHANNNESNLRALCPNCHSQTRTYKNRNRGNGRKLAAIAQ